MGDRGGQECRSRRCVQNRLGRELMHGAPATHPGRVPAGAPAAARRVLRGGPLWPTQADRTRVAAALKRSREGALVWGLQPGQGRAQAQGPRRVAFSIVSVCSGQELVRPSPALASREVGTATPAWATSGSPGSLNVKRGVNYK